MTTDSNPRARMVRFATFEADLSAGELRKGGVKIKVHGQPFEVLAMLLEQPGEIVPREELKQKLWPTDTFVDFDHGVNTAIKRLREALGDSAENPRFVETIPRRGYRFIAPIEPLAAAPAVKPGAIEASPLARVNPDLPPELEHIITKALEKDRKLRYQHATHSQTDLERLKRDSETARMVASKGLVLKESTGKQFFSVAYLYLLSPEQATSICIAFRNSPTRTRLSSPTSRTRRATRSSTARCGKPWLCSSNNPLF